MLTDPILHLGPGLRRQFLAPLWPACSGKGADTSGTPANLRADEAEAEDVGFASPDARMPVRLLFSTVEHLSHSGRMPHLAKRLGFNLPDSLPGHSKPLPNLLKRQRVVVQQSVTQLQNHSFPVAQRRNHRV